MGRKHRPDSPGQWCHVGNRGIAQELIFRSDGDRRRFLALLKRMSERQSVEVHAYCLMGNHFHLVLHDPRGRLAAALGQLSAMYTKTFNANHDRDGPLFRGRYWSRVITTDEQLVATVDYVHHNPVEIEPGIVPSEYRWSSGPAYAGVVPRPSWLRTERVIAIAGRGRVA